MVYQFYKLNLIKRHKDTKALMLDKMTMARNALFRCEDVVQPPAHKLTG